MKRLVLLALAVFFSFASPTNAEDYLLRIDTVGYVDVPADETDPEETVLRSIEVVARPESTFHGKVVNKVATGSETLKLTGKLSFDDDGVIKVQIRHLYSIDTGDRVPTRDGGWEPLLDMTRSVGTVAIAAGEDSVTLGGMDTITNDEGKPERRSKFGTCCISRNTYPLTSEGFDSRTALRVS